MKAIVSGLAALVACAGLARAQCQPEWLPAPVGSYASYGTDQPVDACTTWLPAGQTVPRLVIAGRLNSVAGGSFAHIAVWDGTSWTQLGSGFNGNILAVFDYNGILVATGQFTTAGGVAAANIAQWNGSAWQPLGSGLNSYGTSLAMHSGFLFVGGDFTTAGGIATNRLARWNGSTWVGANAGLNGTVNALGNFPLSGAGVESLIIGGNFTTANGMAASHIAGYNLDTGSVWYTLGTGTNGQVYAIKEGLGNLYVGGSFTSAGGVDTGGYARWNGFSWQANGGHFAGSVYALENYFDQVSNSQQMVVGGFYPGIGGSPSIAYYNGSTYSTLGTGGMGPSGSVFCMTNYNSSLIVGGGFLTAGGTSVQNLARWSGSQSTATVAQSGWSVLAPAPSAPVRALLPSGGGMFVGGDFNYKVNGSDLAPHLASTDGTTSDVVTDCLGCGHVTGTNGSIRALGSYVTGTIFQVNHLIMGGTFTQAGGFNANNVAQFSTNGGGYAAMGTGTDGPVNAAIQFGSHAIVGGSFTTAGGLTANGIAQWNGAWATMGTGLAPSGGVKECDALAIYNGELMIGGRFASANGVASPSIVGWNGTSFLAVPGATLSGTVKALTVYNNQLIAAGDFTSTSGPVLDRVAAWNGTTWTPMNAGLPSAALLTGTSLAVHQGDLYLGCAPLFSEGVGSPRTVYKWNGAAWAVVNGSPLRPVYALASAAGDLWAAGDFGVASGHATPYLTKIQCACYANCDNSNTAPVLNVNDFACFLNAYAAGSPYANCDNSTTPPVLNVLDFACFLNTFAAGCP